MSLTKFSDAAWEIASRYSDLLASETRDLAGAIDAALARAAIAAMPSWRPIESAPRSQDDLIDIWCVPFPDDDFKPEHGGIRLTAVFWYVADEISPHTGWARITDDGGLDFVEREADGPCGLPAWKPTHWMPPPPKPEGDQT